MFYDIDAVIEGMTYEELVKILKEQNIELLYLKAERQEAERDKKDIINKYNKVVKQYKMGKVEDAEDKEQEIKELKQEIKALKGKAKEDINNEKKAREKDLEMMMDYIEDIEKQKFKPNTTRGSSLSKHQKETVIKRILNGLSDAEISRMEKIDRKTINKIRTAGYKSKKTNKEIVGIINHLLKINQNPDYIKKLKDLKNRYMSL